MLGPGTVRHVTTVTHMTGDRFLAAVSLFFAHVSHPTVSTSDAALRLSSKKQACGPKKKDAKSQELRSRVKWGVGA